MKTLLYTTIISLLPLIAFLQNNQIEISSEGICFPQLSTEDRDLLEPIEGQCIFNTSTKRLECYIEFDGWGSINSLLSDQDNDTQVQVEKSPDEDIIYFLTQGLNSLVIRSSDQGDTRIEPNAFGFDSSYRGNIFLGAESGHNINNGIQNVMIGTESGVTLSDGNSNTALGTLSGAQLTTGFSNTFLGANSGEKTIDGFGNTYVGSSAGRFVRSGSNNTSVGTGTTGPTNGSQNVFVGARSGEEIHNASNNVFVGVEAGSDADGDHNVFLGYTAGGNFNTNAKLAIESNPDGDTFGENSLIYGDFENDFVTINHTLNVSKILKLQALEQEPLCDEEAYGSIYMSATNDKLKLCTSMGWKGIALDP